MATTLVPSPSHSPASSPAKSNNDILLIHMPFPPDKEWITKMESRYPGFKVRWYTRPWTFEQIALPDEAYQGVTMLCVVTDSPVKLPNLRYVHVASAGADIWLKSPLYQNPNIVFCTSNGTHPPQIAEWVIGTYLLHSHHFLTYFTNSLKSPATPPTPLLHLQVQDSPGLRMGILGYGAIGRQIARLAQALGMEVYAYTRREKPTPEARRDDSYVVPGTGDPEGRIPAKWFHGAEKEDINTFLAQDLDVLVVSLPLTAATKKILSYEQFQVLEKTAEGRPGNRKTFISNIARGEHIDTDALIDALETGKIRGAALDVTDPEPLPEGHRLLKMMADQPGKVFVTPHVSWQTPHYFERVLAIMERNLEVLINGDGDVKKLINVIDRDQHY